MALEWCQNFVSAQYLENELKEFDQVLHTHRYWQHEGWDCYMSIFTNSQQNYGPWLLPKFCFRSKFWEQINGISSNFAYVLTRSRLGLLCVSFRKSTQYLHRYKMISIQAPCRRCDYSFCDSSNLNPQDFLYWEFLVNGLEYHSPCSYVTKQFSMQQRGTKSQPAHKDYMQIIEWNDTCHPAGDVTRVSVMPRKVTVKIGDAENRCLWCRDKNQWKRANIPLRLVLSRVPFKSEVWN